MDTPKSAEFKKQNLMAILTLKEFKKSKGYKRIMERSKSSYEKIMPTVRKIMDMVEKEGDPAIIGYTKKFDKAELESLQVSKKEIKRAYEAVDSAFMGGLDQMIRNITCVHRNQLPSEIKNPVEPEPGVKVWKRWCPIDTVGIYIPGGKANYPSTVLMTAIPARIAGCKNIVLITPPNSEGTISPHVIVAADKVGITQIFKAGGAQAIAALTYGTESIPKVNKIFGPGNAFVAAAKIEALARGEVAIDSPAGPSEVFIIADETANPRWVAADLLADGEHGEDSACILATTSAKFAKAVAKEINEILPTLETRERAQKALENYGQIIVVDSMKDAITLSNEYAPEHLEIITKKPEEVAKEITNAGSVFTGEFTCKSSGDYATGANHVLPTGGAARMFSGLSVLDYMKLIEFQSVTQEGLINIRKTIETLSEVEELPAHKYSCQVRFEK